MKRISLYATLLFLVFVFSECGKEEDKPDTPSGCPDCPVITSMIPNYGKSGDVIVLKGKNLEGSVKITFNSTEAVFDADSVTDSEISVTVPSIEKVKTAEVKVFRNFKPPGGGSVQLSSETTTTFYYTPTTPELSSIDPGKGSAGTSIMLKGQQLDDVRRVTFNGVDANLISSTPLEVNVTVPILSVTGDVDVIAYKGFQVDEDTVEIKSNALSFYYEGAGCPECPLINQLQPKYGKEGDTIKITGKNFTNVSDVMFNNTSVTILEETNNDFEVDVIVPQRGSSAEVNVVLKRKITTQSGSELELNSEPKRFTYLPDAPTITSLLPAEGIAGTEVIITGSRLNEVKKVLFKNTEASIEEKSGTQIKVKAPDASQLGEVTVRVLSEYEIEGSTVELSSNNVSFTYLEQLIITGFSPDRGRAGTEVSVFGNGFGEDASMVTVKMNNRTCTIREINNNRIKIEVPAITESSKITVTRGSISTTSEETFYLIPESPELISVSPSEGVVGDEVTVQGSRLNGVTKVLIDNYEAEHRIVSGTELKVTLPEINKIGSAQLKVQKVVTIGGSEEVIESNTLSIEYVRPLGISGFTPKRVRSNDEIRITGQNFGTNAGALRVYLNEFPATIQSVTDGEIVCRVPSKCGTGKIKIEKDGKEVIGEESFVFLPSVSVETYKTFSSPPIKVKADHDYVYVWLENGELKLIDPQGSIRTESISAKGGNRSNYLYYISGGSPFAGFSDVSLFYHNNGQSNTISSLGTSGEFVSTVDFNHDGQSVFGHYYTGLLLYRNTILITPTENFYYIFGGDIQLDENKIKLPRKFTNCTSKGRYLTDESNALYRLVDESVQRYAGSGMTGYRDEGLITSSFGSVMDVELVSDYIYVVDGINNCIRGISEEQDVVFTLAGTGGAGNNTGSGVNARFNNPVSLDLDEKTGILYIADKNNNAVKKIIFE